VTNSKKKTKKKVTRIQREYNLEEGVLVMGGIKFPLIGLPPEVTMKLAMIGLGSLLCKTIAPLVLFEKIKQNRFGHHRSYANTPKIVHAVARVENISMDKAVKYYATLDKDLRTHLKENIDIKKMLLIMQMEALTA